MLSHLPTLCVKQLCAAQMLHASCEIVVPGGATSRHYYTNTMRFLIEKNDFCGLKMSRTGCYARWLFMCTHISREPYTLELVMSKMTRIAEPALGVHATPKRRLLLIFIIINIFILIKFVAE